MAPSKEEMLESENRALKAEVVELRRRVSSLDGRLDEIRRSLDHLGAHAETLENLFVASTRLHAAPDLPDALRVVSDILRDLVGAQRYAVYMYEDGSGSRPRAIVLDEMSKSAPDVDAPALAGVDLTLGGRKVGVVRIFELLPQKKGRLSELDHELISLVGQQTAAALLAKRHARAAILEEFVQYLVEEKAR